jgi:hypothetical protein
MFLRVRYRSRGSARPPHYAAGPWVPRERPPASRRWRERARHENRGNGRDGVPSKAEPIARLAARRRLAGRRDGPRDSETCGDRTDRFRQEREPRAPSRRFCGSLPAERPRLRAETSGSAADRRRHPARGPVRWRRRSAFAATPGSRCRRASSRHVSGPAARRIRSDPPWG